MNIPLKKILIIEDDRNYLFILKTGFLKENFMVLTAESGKTGIELAIKEKPNLIIIDLLLPDIYGIEVAKKLKEAGIKAPLLFLTNVQDDKEISRALETVMADYLVKSDTKIEDLISLIKNKFNFPPS